MNIFKLSMPLDSQAIDSERRTKRYAGPSRLDRESPIGEAMAGTVYYAVLDGLTNQQIARSHGISVTSVARVRRGVIYRNITRAIDDLHAERDNQAVQYEDD